MRLRDEIASARSSIFRVIAMVSSGFGPSAPAPSYRLDGLAAHHVAAMDRLPRRMRRSRASVERSHPRIGASTRMKMRLRAA
jgi:hypothetical protein